MRRVRIETTFSSKSFIQTTHLETSRISSLKEKRSVISFLEVRIDFLMFFTYIYAFYVETDYGRNLILVFIW